MGPRRRWHFSYDISACRANNVEIIEPYPNFKFKDDVIQKNPVNKTPIDNNNKKKMFFNNISFSIFIFLCTFFTVNFFKNVIIGCTDELAFNYDNTANDDDESCTYPEIFYDCDGVL